MLVLAGPDGKPDGGEPENVLPNEEQLSESAGAIRMAKSPAPASDSIEKGEPWRWRWQ
jgi:hypothetical protein